MTSLEKEGPPLDMDALSLEDSGDEGVMIGDKKEDADMFASALGEPPQADSPPPDSGIADTMEDLSLQEEEVPAAPASTLKPVELDDEDIFAPPVVINNQDDEEDDLFKSAAPPPVEEKEDDLFKS